MRIEGDTLLFESTGRAREIFRTVGLSLESDQVTTGWDHVVANMTDGDDDDPLTPAERRELGLYMVQRWTEWTGKYGRD